jgi:hypothetical protein
MRRRSRGSTKTRRGWPSCRRKERAGRGARPGWPPKQQPGHATRRGSGPRSSSSRRAPRATRRLCQNTSDALPRLLREGKGRRYNPLGCCSDALKRTAVRAHGRQGSSPCADGTREHWLPSQATDTSQKRPVGSFHCNKIALFMPDPLSDHR